MKINKIMIALVFAGLTKAYSQSYEIDPFKFDTINKIDTRGKKQGKWIIYNASNTGGQVKLHAHQKGTFVNNEKHGTWIELYPNGSSRSKIDYEFGNPKGKAFMYNEKGGLNETGTWNNNHWEGVYRAYYKNGKLKFEFIYDKNGKRNGCQKYYHENGMLMRSGNFTNGLEDGYFTDYYDNGKLKSQTFYMNGNEVKISNTSVKGKPNASS